MAAEGSLCAEGTILAELSHRRRTTRVLDLAGCPAEKPANERPGSQDHGKDSFSTQTGDMSDADDSKHSGSAYLRSIAAHKSVYQADSPNGTPLQTKRANSIDRRSSGNGLSGFDLQRRNSIGGSSVEDTRVPKLTSLVDRPRVCQWVYRFWAWFARGGWEAAEQCVACVFLFLNPFQAAFDKKVQFDAGYALGYVLDLALLSCRLQSLRGRISRACDSQAETQGRRGLHRRRAMSSAVELVLVLPYDCILWGTAAQQAVPWLRLLRLVFAPAKLDAGLRVLERSQALPFTWSRGLRLVCVSLLAIHWGACLFYLVTRPGTARHYANAPWLADGRSMFEYYLTASYWSVMSLTTTGHVDVIDGTGNEPAAQGGTPAEYGFAMVIVVASTVFFIYVNANCTSLMLKLNERLVSYRTRLQGVEVYMKRNRVSKDVQQTVRRHFRRSFDEEHGGLKNDAVLDAMPPSLRRTVLLDIHMRTLRRAPLFVGVERALLVQLCALVRRTVLLPEEMLCRQGDMVTEMYVLEEGQLIVVHDPSATDDDQDRANEPRSRSASGDIRTRSRAASGDFKKGVQQQPTYRMLYNAGTTVCELSVLFGLRQRESVEAVKQSTVLMLTKSDVTVLGKEFPDSLDKVTKGVRRRLLSENDLETLEQIETLHDHKSHKHVAQLSDCLFAAAAGETEVLRKALSDGCVDKHDVDFERRTLLHVASSAGQLAVVKLLVDDYKVALDRRDFHGKTALAYAVANNHLQVAQQLCENGAQLGWTEVDVASALCDHAREGNIAALRLLAECRVDLNSKDYDLRTAIHLAASEGSTKCVELLLDAGASVNAIDRFGNTPLRDAVRHGHSVVASMLYERGGKLGYSQVEAAGEACELARTGSLERLTLMVECGLDLNAVDYDTRSALHLAASEGNGPIVDFLLRNKADINAKDRWGGTPLHDAVREGHHSVARQLRGQGAVLGFDEAQASSELCELALRGDKERLLLLIECGANVDAADYDKRRSLHLAASEGNRSIVEALLDAGADVNACDRWGGTPLSDALRQGHHQVADLLRQHVGTQDKKDETELIELAPPSVSVKLAVACGANIEHLLAAIAKL